MNHPVSPQRDSPGHTAPPSPLLGAAPPDQSLDSGSADEAAAGATDSGGGLRGVLIGLMVPTGMTVLNMMMFGVALPAIRDHFDMDADMVALLVTAYMLPFVLFTPVFGKLGDGLGKRRLFSLGIVIFAAGTVVCLFSTGLGMLFLGRIVQGIGTAGVNPLSIAIITDLFPPTERGRALGTWSSTGPAVTVVAPLVGGFLISRWGWHSIFVPSVLASGIALYTVRGRIPSTMPVRQPGFLREFDWLGLTLLSGGIITFVLYLSSRPVTGIEPFRDWRLLVLALAFCATFFWRERRAAGPLVPLRLYGYSGFGRGSLVAAIREFLMGGVLMLVPLYLADIHGFNAAMIGLFLTGTAASLLLTVRFGGRLADKWDKRLPVLIGLTSQTIALVTLAQLPASAPEWAVLATAMLYGLGAGFSLAVLHHVAMNHIPEHDSGTAAGIYSMGRFFGSVLGATLMGVFLQQALVAQPEVVAYQMTFWFAAVFAIVSVVLAWGIRE